MRRSSFTKACVKYSFKYARFLVSSLNQKISEFYVNLSIVTHNTMIWIYEPEEIPNLNRASSDFWTDDYIWRAVIAGFYHIFLHNSAWSICKSRERGLICRILIALPRTIFHTKFFRKSDRHRDVSRLSFYTTCLFTR